MVPLVLIMLAAAASNTTIVTAVRIEKPVAEIRITLDDGGVLVFPKDEGIPSLDPPQISKDHRSVAWAEEDYLDANYTDPVGILVWRDGKLFGPDCGGGAPFSWGFVGTGAKIRVDCSFPHGES